MRRTWLNNGINGLRRSLAAFMIANDLLISLGNTYKIVWCNMIS
jgi:hypothetical protein